MPGLDLDISEGLRRLTDPTVRSETVTFDGLAGRRRRRRIRNTVFGVLSSVVILVLVSTLVSLASDDDTTVTADGDPDSSSLSGEDATVSVERIEVVGSDDGTARVVIDFDGPLPGSSTRYVDEIASADAGDEVIYTTQEAAGVHVCDSVHSFPPPAQGTVDLLIPAKWFARGEDTHTSPLETIADPAKFVVCGPHNGFFQYSIWGPVSADAADVNVTVGSDGRRLTVQIGQASGSTTGATPTVGHDDTDAAEAVVSAFLGDLRTGGPAAAADLWTGQLKRATRRG